MDLKIIKERVKAIKKVADDDEAAHSDEDSLREDFIRHIAKRKDAIGKMAKEVLKTEKIQFSRWCA